MPPPKLPYILFFPKGKEAPFSWLTFVIHPPETVCLDLTKVENFLLGSNILEAKFTISTKKVADGIKGGA